MGVWRHCWSDRVTTTKLQPVGGRVDASFQQQAAAPPSLLLRSFYWIELSKVAAVYRQVETVERPDLAVSWTSVGPPDRGPWTVVWFTSSTPCNVHTHFTQVEEAGGGGGG